LIIAQAYNPFHGFRLVLSPQLSAHAFMAYPDMAEQSVKFGVDWSARHLTMRSQIIESKGRD